MSGENSLTHNRRRATSRHAPLATRAATVAIALPIVLFIVWLGSWFLFGLLTLVLALLTLELNHLMRNAQRRPAIWFSFALALLLLIAATLPWQRLILLSLGIGLALVLSFPLFFTRDPEQRPLADWGLTITLALYQGWPLSCMLLLRGNVSPPWPFADNAWAHIPPGFWWLCLALLGAWSADAGAFHIGRAFGKRVHPLAPRISPGKNIEGLIGATLFATITSLVIGILLLHLPWYLCLLLGIILGPSSIGGDLAASLIKREAHAKDSGTVMPGHGGMLDRCDSILFSAIIVYCFTLLL